MTTHRLHDETPDIMEFDVSTDEVIYELELIFDAIVFSNTVFAVEDEANVREVTL